MLDQNRLFFQLKRRWLLKQTPSFGGCTAGAASKTTSTTGGANPNDEKRSNNTFLY